MDNIDTNYYEEVNTKWIAGIVAERDKGTVALQFIRDAAAYLRLNAFNEGVNNDAILATLVHDITGLANREPCFLPRVSGYAKLEKEGK